VTNTTLTLISKSPGPSARGEAWALCVALDCDDLAATPVRLSLAGVDEVEIGRGDARAFRRTGSKLRIDVSNPGASQVHARLCADGDAWVVADAGSKNGTYVGTAKVDRAALSEGDVLECGGSCFVLRRAPITGREIDEPDPRLGALRTLSPALQRELSIVPKLARSKLAILVGGESGTGKDVAAQTIHELSGRRGSIVAVNCGAIPPTLIESELFGSKRGAFSGAEDRLGLVRAADGGTLFLDEVAELPAPAQAALLRLLQNGEVMAVGASKVTTVDVRIVAATHQRLDKLSEGGRFRRDLYARLRGHELRLPRLASRIEDLGLLIAALLARIEPHGPRRRLARAAARALFAHPWPFHIRELEQTLRGAVAIAEGSQLAEEDLRLSVPDEAWGPEPERDVLIAELRRHDGNLSAVARELATSRSQVRRLLERHALTVDMFRRSKT